jgi:hypothetical protein
VRWGVAFRPDGEMTQTESQMNIRGFRTLCDLQLSSLIFDYDDGDVLIEMSDNMAMDFDGYMMMPMSSNMTMDMDTGELHITSGLNKDEEE